MSRYRISVDIGGTFTDIVVFDQTSEQSLSTKVLTTVGNLAQGVVNGIGQVVEDFREIDYFVHGTTSGLNAFLERKGARVALLVTEGFRDVYEIGRANRPEIYNIKYKRPERLVKRKDIYEIPERLLADGGVERHLDMDALEATVKQIVSKGYDSVAVCLLHAYKNPVHEAQIHAFFADNAPQLSVSISSEIAKEWREYERTSTTVINAYIAPIVQKYLESLEALLKQRGYNNDIYVMQSNGGVMTAQVAKRRPLQTLMSGPVGGTINCMNLAEIVDDKNLICTDMGGTSFDLSLVVNGEPDITPEAYLEGFPILSPMINIHTVGAGGGSLAWLEGMGLRVGPQSAGSIPGPACYGRGGQQPTITDANLVLGRLQEDSFSGSNLALDREAAMQAIESVASQIHLSVRETAEGMCEIANAKMADAIRALTVKKGIDPRDFALVAFGGAGAMHAAYIAMLLNVSKVIVPSDSGTFSAGGMLKTDIRYDAAQNFVHVLAEVDVARMEAVYEELEQEVQAMISLQKIRSEDIALSRSVELRYVGQEYTVTVADDGKKATRESLESLSDSFHDIYKRKYGHNNRQASIEIVNLRVSGIGKLEKVKFARAASASDATLQSRCVKEVSWGKQVLATPIYAKSVLGSGHQLGGPAIIEDKSATIAVPPGFLAEVDHYGNVMMLFVGEADQQ